MSADCLFCRILRGEIPSQRVYEDAHAFAFLDIRPLQRGHTLVIPKVHAARLEELPATALAGLWNAVHRLLAPVSGAVGATATTVAVNNGPDAGQEVLHVHVHVVPRTPGDGAGPIHALFRRRPDVSSQELAHMADRIRTALGTAPAARTA